MRRVRVERAVDDHGYTDGWVVLTPGGNIIAWWKDWTGALAVANHAAAELTA